MNDFDTCKIAKDNIEMMREKVRNIDVGYLGLDKKEEEEETKVDVGTQPIAEELLVEKEKVEPEEMAVKGSDNGDEDESIRETMKYNG